MRSATLVATLLAFAFSCVAALGQASKVPKAVAADLKAIAAECTGAGGKALTADAVKRVDLNGDGKEDFVLDVGSINCDGAPGIYGDREKGVTVYVGNGKNGAKKAYAGSVFGVKIEGKKLWLTVAGTDCGKKPAANFADEKFCDRAITWDGKKKAFEFAPVSTVRMI